MDAERQRAARIIQRFRFYPTVQNREAEQKRRLVGAITNPCCPSLGVFGMVRLNSKEVDVLTDLSTPASEEAELEAVMQDFFLSLS